MAKLDNIEIKTIVRYGKNGRKYVWKNPTQQKLYDLIEKYGIDEVVEEDKLLWLQW